LTFNLPSCSPAARVFEQPPPVNDDALVFVPHPPVNDGKN